MPRAKKSLGQNFLVDSGIVNQIFQYVNPDSDDNFLEIGPGKGAITKVLLSKANQTHAVEIDDDLLKKLSRIESRGNLHLHNSNILDFDPREISPNRLRLIGNLPYNISTPIILWTFKYLDFFLDMHFMFQKEFGDRLVAENNTKNLNMPWKTNKIGATLSRRRSRRSRRRWLVIENNAKSCKMHRKTNKINAKTLRRRSRRSRRRRLVIENDAKICKMP